MTEFEKIYDLVVDLLKVKLPKHLTYHSLEHTLYVLDRVVHIGAKENVSKKDIRLLKVAALFHDTGFTKSPLEHEKNSCKIARKKLKQFDFSEDELTKICGMIMATKIPQKPRTHLEEILADADLEYLATAEFYPQGEKLYQELLHSNPNMTRDQWNGLQIKSISNHHYHTAYCKRYKEHRKQKNLNSLLT